MKLSDAIKLGSMLVPTQHFADYFSGYGSTVPAAACALGAAKVAGCTDPWKEDEAKVWPWILGEQSMEVACPCCGNEAFPVSIIIHLNDHHRWTRERIADWVSTIEPEEAEAVEQPAETVQA